MANKIASRALMLEREPMSPTRAVPTVDKIVDIGDYDNTAVSVESP